METAAGIALVATKEEGMKLFMGAKVCLKGGAPTPEARAAVNGHVLNAIMAGFDKAEDQMNAWKALNSDECSTQ